MAATDSQLRADAQENRDRILAAARAVFAQQGLDVGLREVARRAGVGPATLYRRFPTKRALIDAAFEAELGGCRRIVLEGRADPDPWNGFVTAIRRLTELNTRNRGFVAALTDTDTSRSAVAAHRSELMAVLGEIARDAQAAGDLRPDFRLDDLRIVLLAGRGLSSVGAGARGRAAARFAELVADAFRAERTASAPRKAPDDR